MKTYKQKISDSTHKFGTTPNWNCGNTCEVETCGESNVVSIFTFEKSKDQTTNSNLSFNFEHDHISFI
jgi:hypothetical protein